MDSRKLLLISALLFAVILGEFASTASATSSNHGHHSKQRHRRHPPPPPKRAPPPPVTPSGPPAPCAFTYGPWPATVPPGSVSFNDGAHLNFSSLTVISTLDGVNGLLVTYVDAGPTFFQAHHGAGSGEGNTTIVVLSVCNLLFSSFLEPFGTNQVSDLVVSLLSLLFTFDLSTPQNNVVFRQLRGTYTSAGLDSITFSDSHGNTYIWGAKNPFDPIQPGQTGFTSPPNSGYVIGLFGAANATALTQIGVCVTGA